MAPDPFNTALSATLITTFIFPFLELPPEIRAYIYHYALTAPDGIWMDVDRRQLPPLWLQKNIMPSVGDIQGAMRPLPIISPALLRVCKQIYMEARIFIRRNTMNFTSWSNNALCHIPKQVKDSMHSAYYRVGAESSAGGANPITQRLRFLRHLTLGLLDDDEGLKGATKPSWPNEDQWQNQRVPNGIIYSYVGKLFREGKLKTFRLECPSTYTSALYPFVWVWACVERSFRDLLLRDTHHPLEQLYAAFTEFLRWSDETTFLVYQRMLVDGPVYLETGEELRRAISRIQKIWEDNGVRVSARDPEGFERGTVITFERVITEEKGEREAWGDNELVPEIRRGAQPPNFPVVVDLSKLDTSRLPSFITVVYK